MIGAAKYWVGGAMLLAGVFFLGLAGIREMNALARPYFYSGPPALSKTKYQKSPHTRQVIKRVNGEYRFDWTFRDHKGRDWTWGWGYDIGETNRDIEKFGVPKWMFQPYRVTSKEKRRRERTLRKGLYRLRGNTLLPDYARMISFYSNYTRPLYELLRRTVPGGSRNERIQTLMKFVQDIPYGIPPENDGDRVISGIIPPPQLFTEGWGDCDSKAVLFSAIMAHDPDYEVIYLFVPKHMFSAVRGVPRPYQQYVTYRGKKYIIAETVGPGRPDYGRAGNEVYRRFRVEKIPILRPRADPQRGLISSYLKAGRSLQGKGPRIVADRLRGNRLELVIRSRAPVELMAQLSSRRGPLKNQAFMQKRGDDFLLTALFDRPGNYEITLFSRPKGASGGYRFVLKYPFENRKSYPRTAGFPQAYSAFAKVGGFLQSPMNGVLRRGTTESFSVEVPGAIEAVVIMGQKWVPLEKRGNKFFGRVPLQGREAVLAAKFPSNRKSFSVLLRYRLR